jgi:hypothetical protein
MQKKIVFEPNRLYMLKPGKYTLNAALVEITEQFSELKPEDYCDDLIKEYIMLRFAQLPNKEKTKVAGENQLTIHNIYSLLPTEVKQEPFYKINLEATTYCVPHSCLEEIRD